MAVHTVELSDAVADDRAWLERLEPPDATFTPANVGMLRHTLSDSISYRCIIARTNTCTSALRTKFKGIARKTARVAPSRTLKWLILQHRIPGIKYTRYISCAMVWSSTGKVAKNTKPRCLLLS